MLFLLLVEVKVVCFTKIDFFGVSFSPDLTSDADYHDDPDICTCNFCQFVYFFFVPIG